MPGGTIDRDGGDACKAHAGDRVPPVPEFGTQKALGRGKRLSSSIQSREVSYEEYCKTADR